MGKPNLKFLPQTQVRVFRRNTYNVVHLRCTTLCATSPSGTFGSALRAECGTAHAVPALTRGSRLRRLERGVAAPLRFAIVLQAIGVEKLTPAHQVAVDGRQAGLVADDIIALSDDRDLLVDDRIRHLAGQQEGVRRIDA